jgi:hypothetical protein
LTILKWLVILCCFIHSYVYTTLYTNHMQYIFQLFVLLLQNNNTEAPYDNISEPCCYSFDTQFSHNNQEKVLKYSLGRISFIPLNLHFSSTFYLYLCKNVQQTLQWQLGKVILDKIDISHILKTILLLGSVLIAWKWCRWGSSLPGTESKSLPFQTIKTIFIFSKQILFWELKPRTIFQNHRKKKWH